MIIINAVAPLLSELSEEELRALEYGTLLELVDIKDLSIGWGKGATISFSRVGNSYRYSGTYPNQERIIVPEAQCRYVVGKKGGTKYNTGRTHSVSLSNLRIIY